MKDFYVYVYLDPRKPGNYNYIDFKFEFEPFYIGMSKLENRMYDHLKEAKNRNGYNKKKINKINKILEHNLTPIIIKVEDNLSKSEASDLESLLISRIGRENLNKGPLTNLTDGGDGTYGYIPTKKSKEKWYKSINKYYSKQENKDKYKYYNTLDYFIDKYGKKEGFKKYNDRIEKIKRTTKNTYKDPSIREKCRNKGINNPMYGTKAPTSVKIEIDGTIYDSIYDAFVNTKIPYTTICQRLKSKSFKNYRRL